MKILKFLQAVPEDCPAGGDEQMTEQVIRFIVYGEPKPQGSKKSQVIYRNGKPALNATGRVLTVVRDDNPDVQGWRNQVAEKALAAYGGTNLLTGPVRLTIQFVRPRPKGHFGSGKNAALLKPSAPAFPTSKPDTLKLARAVEDALTGCVWRDDSQVVEHVLSKRYGERFATIVEIQAITEAEREVKL